MRSLPSLHQLLAPALDFSTPLKTDAHPRSPPVQCLLTGLRSQTSRSRLCRYPVRRRLSSLPWPASDGADEVVKRPRCSLWTLDERLIYQLDSAEAVLEVPPTLDGPKVGRPASCLPCNVELTCPSPPVPILGICSAVYRCPLSVVRQGDRDRLDHQSAARLCRPVSAGECCRRCTSTNAHADRTRYKRGCFSGHHSG